MNEHQAARNVLIKSGWDPQVVQGLGAVDLMRHTGGTPEPARTPAQTFNTSDIGNGERLIHLYGQNLRYCYTWKSWLVWDGKRWAKDGQGQAEALAKDTARAIYQEAATATNEGERKALAKHALRTENAQRVAAMLAMAQSEPGIPATPADLDADAWLLNCRNGTLDLRTGELREHRREDLITHLVPVDYNPAAAAPLWLSFLDRIMAGNQALIDFLQRLAGYCLTGDTSDQVFVILHGSGANGKTTFVETLLGALGDLGQRIPTDTLLRRRNEGIPSDVARMRGARMVAATESEQGRRLAEALVKMLTGGDTVVARHMYSEWFEFEMQAKVILSTNHKPRIRGTDNAIWRRIRLIPFAVRIPEAEQDKQLTQKLRGELAGVLRWAVDGCMAWQRGGLAAPREVQAATRTYRDQMDEIGAFVADCCDVGQGQEVTVRELYEAYKVWHSDAETDGKPRGKVALGNELVNAGIAKRAKIGRERWYTGVGIKGVMIPGL